MTHENNYRISNTGNLNRDGLTLYEAVKALRGIPSESRTDATCIVRDGRCVAYASEWHKVVRPMYQANAAERDVILSWEFELCD